MKQEKQFQTLQSSQRQLKSITTNQTTELFSELQLQCSCFQPAHEYCCEQTCKSNAVTCLNQDCKCQIPHQNCDNFLKVKKFHQKINNKIIHYKSENFQDIEKSVDSIIDKVSQMLESISLELKTFGLNKNEYIMRGTIASHFNNIESKQTHQKLTGQNLFRFRAEQKEADRQWLDYSLKKYQAIIQETKKALDPFFQEIQNSINSIHAKHDLNNPLKAYFSNSLILKSMFTANLKPQLLNLMDILNTNIKVDDIKKLYTYKRQIPILNPNKQVVSPSLFGQSINQTKLEQFQPNKQIVSQHDQILSRLKEKSNLLFIVQNISGKTFGAYSSCKFLQKNQEWMPDSNSESFLFALQKPIFQRISDKNQGLRFNSKALEIGGGKFSTMHSKNGLTLYFKNSEITTEIILSQANSQLQYQSNQGTLFGRNPQTYVKSSTPVNGNYWRQDVSDVNYLEVYQVKETHLSEDKILQINFSKKQNQ